MSEKEIRVRLLNGDGPDYIVVTWMSGNCIERSPYSSKKPRYYIKFNPLTELVEASDNLTGKPFYSTKWLHDCGWYTDTTKEDIEKQIESQKFDDKMEKLLND